MTYTEDDDLIYEVLGYTSAEDFEARNFQALADEGIKGFGEAMAFGQRMLEIYPVVQVQSGDREKIEILKREASTLTNKAEKLELARRIVAEVREVLERHGASLFFDHTGHTRPGRLWVGGEEIALVDHDIRGLALDALPLPPEPEDEEGEPEDEEGEPREFDVEVCRVGYGTLTLRVSATSPFNAELEAEAQAGNHLFSEHDSEYEAVSVTEV